jgi:hypothetical protein
VINEAQLHKDVVSNINIQIYHINREAEPVFTLTLTIQRLWGSHIYSVQPQRPVKVQLSLHKYSSCCWVEVIRWLISRTRRTRSGLSADILLGLIPTPSPFRVTSLHCYTLQRDQRHLNQTDGWNASSTDYFHYSSFTPSAQLFVSLRLFCRL